MIDLRRFEEIKRASEQAKAQADRETGRLESLMESLAKKFGCKSLAEAKKKLATLASEDEKLEKQFNRELLDLEQDWKSKLEGEQR